MAAFADALRGICEPRHAAAVAGEDDVPLLLLDTLPVLHHLTADYARAAYLARRPAGRVSGRRRMDLIRVDAAGALFVSPDIEHWDDILSCGITGVIDADGDLDAGVPTWPDRVVYVYFPFDDGELPDLVRLHAVAALGAEMVAGGRKVLCHCLMGYNRSALVAGLVLVHLGMSGAEALATLRRRRPGALYNKTFAAYLESLPGRGPTRPGIGAST